MVTAEDSSIIGKDVNTIATEYLEYALADPFGLFNMEERSIAFDELARRQTAAFPAVIIDHQPACSLL